MKKIEKIEKIENNKYSKNNLRNIVSSVKEKCKFRFIVFYYWLVTCITIKFYFKKYRTQKICRTKAM